MSKWIAYCA